MILDCSQNSKFQNCLASNLFNNDITYLTFVIYIFLNLSVMIIRKNKMVMMREQFLSDSTILFCFVDLLIYKSDIK